jgi:predicted  nucleic acid-binding Zn-ribbon protein
MSDVFDPSRHRVVAVDRETREHVHVTLAELVRDAREIAPAQSVDLSAIYARLDAVEARKQAAPVDLKPVMDAVTGLASDVLKLAERLRENEERVNDIFAAASQTLREHEEKQGRAG